MSSYRKNDKRKIHSNPLLYSQKYRELQNYKLQYHKNKIEYDKKKLKERNLKENFEELNDGLGYNKDINNFNPDTYKQLNPDMKNKTDLEVYTNHLIDNEERLTKKIDDEKLINILIRTTYRPTFFRQCVKSILDQKYKNYKIICCYDDERCLDYLKDYEDKIEYFYIEIKSNVSHKYNLYCNLLMDTVKEGWIMFLDDDDKFSIEHTLTIINSKLNNENDILFWQFLRTNDLIYPKNINNIIPGQVCNSTFCFHSKHKNLSRWTGGQLGDFNFLDGLLKKNDFNRIGIKIALVENIWKDSNRSGSNGMKEKSINMGIVTQHSYPGGGGEEFILDIITYFKKKNIIIYWFTFENWNNNDNFKSNLYTNIKINNKISLIKPNELCGILFKYNLDYLLHQGRGHNLIYNCGSMLNIPTITIWCFWEEIFNSDISNISIKDNINKYEINNQFLNIIKNIDHYYLASKFLKEIIELKYKINIPNDNIFLSLSHSNRVNKDNIKSINNKYISLLNSHFLKGADVFSELIKRNPKLNFLSIYTEKSEEGKNLILKSMNLVNNKNNKFLDKRVNNIKDIYNITKVLLCPTHLDETFCRVVYESFLNKIPVIFSNKGNLQYLEKEDFLIVKDNNVDTYNVYLNKLFNDDIFYNNIIEKQYNYVMKLYEKYPIENIYNKFIQLSNKICIFTPWSDQGLGIQSRIYREILTNNGYKVYIYSTINKFNNIKNNEWDIENKYIYYDDTFRDNFNIYKLKYYIEKNKIKKLIIPEINNICFKIPKYLNCDCYGVINIECLYNYELNELKNHKFKKLFLNNIYSYNILKTLNIPRLYLLNFKYIIPKIINFKNKNIINLNKTEKIKILHLTGFNGIKRKRTFEIINIFSKIYKYFQNFELNISIQGNFNKKINSLPFLNIINKNNKYIDIINLYNDSHLCIYLSSEEGLGLGMYESLYLKCPIIALDSPPFNNIIKNKINGYLLSSYMELDGNRLNPNGIVKQACFDEEIITKEILSILEDRESIIKIRNNISSNSNENLEWDNKFIKYLDL